ncbi:MAG: Bax inhibitor-1 family protein [Planctomycetota bacterium]|nr:Bax inhibitor-1 family protein [Planctomycetota bacterium]
MQNNDVFSRTHSTGQLLSPRAYNLAIGLTLGWGFFANYLIVKAVPAEALYAINPIVFLLGFFACAMGGVFLFNKSDKPAVSFLGYNLVVLPFGLVVAMAVGQYTDPKYDGLVLETIQTTGFVTIAMMMLGSMFPAFFQKIVGALTVALIAVILVEVIGGLFFGWSHGVTDWIVVLIFCGYIGYDWGRANAIPKTLDNAIDSAAALYMDIINLFLRLLRILGRRR